MIVQPSYARITLALDIIKRLTEGPRAGYHELGIVKHQVNLYDTIVIEEAEEMEIRCDNPAVPVDSANICWKAVELIRHRHNIRPRARLTLHKSIPVCGGMAGGSANAATVLDMCNRLWALGLTPLQLIEYGRELGMDVPFYFVGGTAFDTEATATLRSIPTAVSLTFVIVLPGFGVPTKDAYARIDYAAIGAQKSMTEQMQHALRGGAVETVVDSVHNDFELSVFPAYPALRNIKQELLDKGCLAAVMSGSGSTMVGIARDHEHACSIARELKYRAIIASSAHHPIGEVRL